MNTITRANRSFRPLAYFACLAIIITGYVLAMADSAGAAAWNVEVRPENRTVLVPGPGEGRILIRIDAPEMISNTDRSPLNLCLVLDKSGSMGDAGKMEYALQAAHQLVNSLGEEDILSIVTYDHRVRTLAKGLHAGNKQKLHRIINNIYPGGRTNLSGGLEEGFRRARRYMRRGYVNRIMLLSDGLANVGVTDRYALQRRASAMSEEGVSISTFGMGYSFDEQLLALMATGGGGSYHYISRSRDIVTALGREFNMVSTTVATGVEIIIRPLGGSRLDGVSGYSWNRNGSDIVVGLGDLSAGERRSLVASLKVSGQEPGQVDVAEVSMRYLDPATGRSVTRPAGRVQLEVVRDEAVYRQNFDDEVVGRSAVIESNILMEKAAGMVDRGDADGAMSVLKKAEGKLKAAPPSVEADNARRENEAYQDKLDNLPAMAPAEVKEMQKGVRYRAYEEVYQK
jgi:Ca-activated chloride channel family protein